MVKSKPLLINARKASESPLNSLMSSEVTLFENKGLWSLMQVGHYQCSAALETPEHCFAQHFISVQLSPAAVIKEQRLNGRLQCGDFSAGDICLTPAAVPVSVRLQAPCEIIGLYIEPAFFTQLAAEVADSDRLELVPQFKLNDPLIYQIAIALKAQISSSGDWQRLYIESMLTAVSAHLLQQYSTRKPNVKTDSASLSKTRLRQVIEYIHEHSDQNLSLLEMAQHVQMSPYYFSHLFKQSTGLSPHQYLISYRIQQAKQMLTTTALSIAEIAAQAGFVDQSHLARHFKRQFGVSPSQFR